MVDSAIITSSQPPKQIGGERQLQKASWISKTPQVAESLEDFGNSNKKVFNQFEGKKSTYNEDMYTSTLDTTKIT